MIEGSNGQTATNKRDDEEEMNDNCQVLQIYLLQNKTEKYKKCNSNVAQYHPRSRRATRLRR